MPGIQWRFAPDGNRWRCHCPSRPAGRCGWRRSILTPATVGYATDGTPVDCVRLARLGLVAGFEAELVVAGSSTARTSAMTSLTPARSRRTLEDRVRVPGRRSSRARWKLISAKGRALTSGGGGVRGPPCRRAGRACPRPAGTLLNTTSPEPTPTALRWRAWGSGSTVISLRWWIRPPRPTSVPDLWGCQLRAR